MELALKIALACAVLLAFAYFFFGRADIAGEEARRLVDGGARLVDVRSKAEFAAGHPSPAINIPVQELEQRLGELEKKDQTIIVYCQSGVRSARAARILK